MDTALELKIIYDRKEKRKDSEINTLLRTSKLIQQLTSEFIEKPLYAVWRIIALSEIPYAGQLDYTKKVVSYISDHLMTEHGFSLTGKDEDILPCYNSMIVEALSKLGYADLPMVHAAVKWIKKFQPFERNKPQLWNGKSVQKYGGCFKATPCYIGIAKSVKALIYYNDSLEQEDLEVSTLIKKGTDYLLLHNLYQRLSNKEPITKHILDLSFPPSYHLNIVELLEIAYKTQNITRESLHDILSFIEKKKTKEGYWKTNYVYSNHGYISFDKRGEKGEWLTYLINKYTEGMNHIV